MLSCIYLFAECFQGKPFVKAAGNGTSNDFRLSQAFASPVVQKGVCGDFILSGLSPLFHLGGRWSASIPSGQPGSLRLR